MDPKDTPRVDPDETKGPVEEEVTGNVMRLQVPMRGYKRAKADEIAGELMPDSLPGEHGEHGEHSGADIKKKTA